MFMQRNISTAALKSIAKVLKKNKKSSKFSVTDVTFTASNQMLKECGRESQNWYIISLFPQSFFLLNKFTFLLILLYTSESFCAIGLKFCLPINRRYSIWNFYSHDEASNWIIDDRVCHKKNFIFFPVISHTKLTSTLTWYFAAAWVFEKLIDGWENYHLPRSMKSH